MKESWCVERSFCQGYGRETREGKGLGCRGSGGERGGTGTLNNGFFGLAVRRLGFRVKMALRELRRQIVRLEGSVWWVESFD